MHGRGWLHSPLPCPLSETRLPFLLMQGRKKNEQRQKKKGKGRCNTNVALLGL